jgi:2-(1,2-epoxy-1,2-dihydrophenyl)acetyl-CoA isomerase
MSESLLRELNDGVLSLRFNRPDRLNALDIPLFAAFREAVEEASGDPDVRVVVVSGEGRAFSSGGDLKSAKDAATGLTPEQRTDRLRRTAQASLLLHRMPKPTIAMVRGAAAGAGMSFALACDFRVVSENASFVPAFAKAAFSGDYGINYLLFHLVGAARAREILMLGERIDANEALAQGLVSRVVPDEELEAETTTLARRLAAGPSVAFRYMKRNLNAAETMSFEEVLDIESANLIACSLTADHAEAVAAFSEKREPRFRGR